MVHARSPTPARMRQRRAGRDGARRPARQDPGRADALRAPVAYRRVPDPRWAGSTGGTCRRVVAGAGACADPQGRRRSSQTERARSRGRWRTAAGADTVRGLDLAGIVCPVPAITVPPAITPHCAHPMACRCTTRATDRSRPRCIDWCSDPRRAGPYKPPFNVCTGCRVPRRTALAVRRRMAFNRLTSRLKGQSHRA